MTSFMDEPSINTVQSAECERDVNTWRRVLMLAVITDIVQHTHTDTLLAAASEQQLTALTHSHRRAFSRWINISSSLSTQQMTTSRQTTGVSSLQLASTATDRQTDRHIHQVNYRQVWSTTQLFTRRMHSGCTNCYFTNFTARQHKTRQTDYVIHRHPVHLVITTVQWLVTSHMTRQPATRTDNVKA